MARDRDLKRIAYLEYLLSLVTDGTEHGDPEAPPPPGILQATAKRLGRKFGKMLPPAAGETCVVCEPDNLKIAALFFDRVWMPPITPEFHRLKNLAFYTGTNHEFAVAWARNIHPLVPGVRKTNNSKQREIKDVLEKNLVRNLSEQIQKELGIESTSLYTSEAAQEAEFKQGTAEALTLIMSNVPTICPNQLEWEQVSEVRKDKDSLNHLRRFKRWLDADMKGKSIKAITDEICIRVDDYQYAIKKHGLQTKVGIVSSLHDFKFLAAAGGSGALTTLVAGGIAGAGTTIALGIGKVAIGLAQRMIDFEHLKRTTNPEIAYVIEIQNRQGKEK